MELPDLGQQCSQFDCKQLDFLPLQCKCGKKFCSEHFSKHFAQCDVFQESRIEAQKINKVYMCSEADCKETSLVPLICERCGQHFCVKHRHFTECYLKDEKLVAQEKEKLVAPVRQFNEAKSVVDKQIKYSLAEAKRKQKNVHLANKVQLMKIKNKAKGLKTIPSQDRIYFNIIYPGNEQGVPVFVSKTWSVGRAVDAIAEECQLRNDNNRNTGRKLRLFKKGDGEIVTKNLADVLHMLINTKVIIDGESLIMNYVDD